MGIAYLENEHDVRIFLIMPLDVIVTAVTLNETQSGCMHFRVHISFSNSCHSHVLDLHIPNQPNNLLQIGEKKNSNSSQSFRTFFYFTFIN